MVHSHASAFVGARQNPDTVGHWTVLDLPRGSSRGEQLAVDADLTATTGRPRAQPHVMNPGAINSRFEPCSVERHPENLSNFDGASLGTCWCLSHSIDSRSIPKVLLTWYFLVRPLGFEPRTCGLRVRCSAVELEAHRPSRSEDPSSVEALACPRTVRLG